MHFGIDYGSKLAGTTVITYASDEKLYQLCSEKKQDADKMILSAAVEHKPKAIYLDAPLSLPGAYYGKGTSFHYRVADKELGAMSPMFLGGLTARAMSLAAQLRAKDIIVYETYPGAFIRSHDKLQEVYSKKDKNCIPTCFAVLEPMFSQNLENKLSTLHQLDSLVAWVSGQRHTHGNASIVGDAKEGLIIY